MVHQHDAIDAVRRTVTRAAKPALAPLRAAAAGLHSQLDAEGDAADVTPTARELDELAAMRDELAAAPDLRVGDPSDRAQRATRSASAYLDARRARLKRELHELHELH